MINDKRIDELKDEIKERDERIKSQANSIYEKDQQIRELEGQIGILERAILIAYDRLSKEGK